jgi:hypothetical protein
MSINNRSIQYLRPDELVQWRNIYRKEVAAELAKEAGEGTSKIVRAQFGRA